MEGPVITGSTTHPHLVWVPINSEPRDSGTVSLRSQSLEEFVATAAWLPPSIIVQWQCGNKERLGVGAISSADSRTERLRVHLALVTVSLVSILPIVNVYRLSKETKCCPRIVVPLE